MTPGSVSNLVQLAACLCLCVRRLFIPDLTQKTDLPPRSLKSFWSEALSWLVETMLRGAEGGPEVVVRQQKCAFGGGL